MTQSLRILFVTDAFPPNSYGSGWSTYHLARGLRAQGHDVRIVVAQPVVRLTSATYDGFSVWQPPPTTRTLNPALFAASGLGPGRVVGRCIRQWTPDIIHAQHINAALVTRLASHRVPTIITVRDHWPVCFYGTALATAPCPGCLIGTQSPCNVRRGSTDAPMPMHVLKWSMMHAMLAQRQRVLGGAAAVIAASKAMHQELEAIVPSSRLYTIPNAVDLSLFTEDDEKLAPDIPDRYFLFVGKLSSHKGADLLAEIASHLGDGAPPILIVGDGVLEDELREQACHGGVRLMGRLPNASVLRLMRQAIALITPARWPEPLSRTHLEALAAGCPIVATDTGGTRDVVADGITGYLAPVNDIEAMSRHLQTLAADAALRSRMSRESRERAARLFGLAEIAARHCAVYEQAIAARARQQS